MRNPSLLNLVIVLSLFTLASPAVAQVINRATDPGIDYIEKVQYVDFSYAITHSEISTLITTHCPNWDPNNPRICTGRASGDELEGARIAGLCFIPEWNIDDPNANNRAEFQTTGINVALVLWKTHSDGPPEVVLAGFENEPTGNESALPSRLANRAIIAASTISYTSAQASVTGGGLSTGGSGQTNTTQPIVSNAVDLTRYQTTREFDFGFLPMRDYWRIKRYNRYYGTTNQLSTGIKVERAFKTMHVDEDINGNTDGNYEATLFRSLMVKPDPEPDFAEYDSEAALSYELVKVCPPGWRDLNAALAALVTRSEEKIEYDIQQQKLPNRYLGAQIFVGVPIVDPFSWSDLNIEIGLVYGLGKDWELQTLFGRYQADELGTVDGVSLQAKRYFRLNIERLNQFRPYIAGGLGAYDLPESNTLGFVLDGGLRYQPKQRSLTINNSLSAISLFQLEAALQYLNFDFLNGTPNSNLVSFKIGLRYVF